VQRCTVDRRLRVLDPRVLDEFAPTKLKKPGAACVPRPRDASKPAIAVPWRSRGAQRRFAELFLVALAGFATLGEPAYCE
jgi:hypothetical protein